MDAVKKKHMKQASKQAVQVLGVFLGMILGVLIGYWLMAAFAEMAMLINDKWGTLAAWIVCGGTVIVAFGMFLFAGIYTGLKEDDKYKDNDASTKDILTEK